MDTNQYLNDDAIESLIAKVLANEANESEITSLKTWRQTNPENESYFNILKQIFEESSIAKENYAFNVDEAWNKVKPQPVFVCALPAKEHKPVAQPLSWIKVAAAILIVAGFSFAAYMMFKEEAVKPVTIASSEKIIHTSLPDSTHIVVNRNSELEYVFTKDQRKVALKGEAFFDIAPDANRQFILEVGSLTIVDIGTAFNVNAPVNSDSIVVYVESGEVKITSSTGKEMNLLKGETGIFMRSSDLLSKELHADTNLVSYKTKIFVFENAPLEVIAAKLNEVYGVNITISDSLINCHLTSTFRNEEIDAILEVIAETLNLKVSKTANKIVLEGSGCNRKED